MDGASRALTHISDATLYMTGVERLAAARRNVFYIFSDIGEEAEAIAEKVADLQARIAFHEAGHAVAFTLAGQSVRDVAIRRFSYGGGGGYCRLADTGTGKSTATDELLGEGSETLFRKIVATYAGGLAEFRHDPRQACSGMRHDMRNAEVMCREMDRVDLGCRFDIQRLAWEEACDLVADEAVWGATTEIARRLIHSRARCPRVSGNAIRNIVSRHVSDGWLWRHVPPSEDQDAIKLAKLAKVAQAALT